MALLQTNMVKNAFNTTELRLVTSANESFIVKNIYLTPLSAINYAKVSVGSATRGYFRFGGPLGCHLYFPYRGHKNILDTLFEKGIFKGYPIHTGGKFTIETTAATNMCVVYDRYGEKEISENLPNGENAKEFVYLAYGQPSGSITTSGQHKISINMNPEEFPMFPFEGEAPSGEMIVHGICFSGRTRTSSSASIYAKTTHLKVMKSEKTFFDEDKNGFMTVAYPSSTANTFTAGGQCVGGEGTNMYLEKPLFFDQPLVFKNGESLDTYWKVEVISTGGSFLRQDMEISYIITKKTV